MTADLVLDELRPSDEERWRELFAAYAAFYEIALGPEQVATVWRWLNDPDHVLTGLVVRQGGTPVAIAHWRECPRPLLGGTAAYLDDLYVDEAAWGRGAASLVLGELRRIAADRGWLGVRWLTRASNTGARAVYDKVARATDLITYDMPADG